MLMEQARMKFGPNGQFSLNTNNVNFMDMTAIETVTAGSYMITETTLPLGWSLDSIACTGNATPETVDLPNEKVTVIVAPNENVECTFVDSAEATLKIKKDTSATGFGNTFGFDVDGTSQNEFGPNGQFSLNTNNVNFMDMTAIETVTAGVYVIREDIIPPGWVLQSIECMGNNIGDVVDLIAKMVTVTVSPGENVECTFIDSAQGTLKVKKDTSSENLGDTFGFDVDGTSQNEFGPNGQFSLNTNNVNFMDMTNAETVTVGSYMITENTIPFGWALASIACTGNATPETVDLPNEKVTVMVAPNENVECTFNDITEGTLKVKKDTSAAGFGAIFGFDVDGTSQNQFGPNGQFSLDTNNVNFMDMTAIETVSAGSYMITETTIPPSWSLDSIACTGNATPETVDLPNDKVTVIVAPGENVECTFVDSAEGTLKVKKDTSAIVFGAIFGFDVDGTSQNEFGPNGQFSLNTNNVKLHGYDSNRDQ